MRGAGGRGRGMSTRGRTSARQLHQVQKQDNPFLVAASNQSNSQNPFLAGKAATSSSQPSRTQLAPPNSNVANPFLADKSITSMNSSSQPPSYASIVSGGAVSSVRPSLGPVPTFITHGPSSVQMLSDTTSNLNPSSTIQLPNQFVSAPQPNPPGSSSADGGLLGLPKFQVPVNVGVPQIPLTARAQGGTAPPPPQLPSYDQATLPTTYQPAPLQGDASALPVNMTLHVKGVPAELNNEAFMEKHFSRFGALKGIECNPQKRYATITFQNKVKILLV